MHNLLSALLLEPRGDQRCQSAFHHTGLSHLSTIAAVVGDRLVLCTSLELLAGRKERASPLHRPQVADAVPGASTAYVAKRTEVNNCEASGLGKYGASDGDAELGSTHSMVGVLAKLVAAIYGL